MSEEKTDYKICPLTLLKEGEPDKCRKEKCAWYVVYAFREECAVVALSAMYDCIGVG